MKNLSQMLKQAQEMQVRMQEMQTALETLEIEGSSGGGLVTVTLNGKGEMKGLHIEASLFTENDREVVEDLIVAAHSDAKQKVDEKAKEEMAKITGGLNLPPGLDLPA